MTTLLSVACALLMGLALLVLPWTNVWDTNALLQVHPLFRAIVLDPCVRGAVSGLGLVNLLLAALEVHGHLRGTAGRISS